MEPRIDMLGNEIGAKIAKRIYNVNLAIEQSPLPKSTQELVSLRASQINGCGWCVDIHTKEAAAAGETALRLNLVAAWRHATVFSEAERAALALTEEGTRLGDAHHGVTDETWAEVRMHYDDDQTVALVAVIALINATNRRRDQSSSSAAGPRLSSCRATIRRCSSLAPSQIRSTRSSRYIRSATFSRM
jgi:AhpD family alkylhydroperoxidase